MKRKRGKKRPERKAPRETNYATNNTSSPITEAEFERLAKKAQERTKQVMSGILKIKVKAHGIKALAQEKQETNLREWEELHSKADEVALSVEKDKEKEKEKGDQEIAEELEKEIGQMSSLEEEAPRRQKRISKVSKKFLHAQVEMRRKAKDKEALQKDDEEEDGESASEESLSAS